MPLLHPGRTAGVVGINTPRWKYRRWGDDPLAWLREHHGPEHYMIFFQEPGIAEAALTGDGDFEAAVARRHRKAPFAAFPLDPDVANQQVRALAQMPIGEPCLSPREVAYYAGILRSTGYAGGLNWYRNMQRNARLLKGTGMDIAVPALMIAATHDPFNPADASLGIETIGPAVERIVLPDSGHWLPDEDRADLSDAIVSWLTRHFSGDFASARLTGETPPGK
jgi:pimeloyl-ACP methyl ester carboxylesterase